MREGMQGEDGRRTMGLREMMDRMRQARQQQMNRYNMASGVMDDLRQKLEEIKQMERAGIQRRMDAQSGENGGQPEGDQAPSPAQGEQDSDALSPEQKRKMLEMIAQRKRDFLDALPQDIPGQIKGLSDYDFMDDQAREKFQELLSGLQQQMMQQYFQGMQQSLQNMSPEDVANLREMIRDLNKMLRERQQGLEPDFDAFMQKHGHYFPGVNSLDDLLEQMQQQMAAMQAIMDNLSPEQRQELEELMDQLLGDDRIRVDMMELAQNLAMMAPEDQPRTRFPFRGERDAAPERSYAYDESFAADGGPGSAI
jgi:uncharacterized protein with von Willebrand factor type A (vWA) domain